MSFLLREDGALHEFLRRRKKFLVAFILVVCIVHTNIFECQQACARLHLHSPGVDHCKTCGQNWKSQTGDKTWICEHGKETFVNLDVEVNKRRVPPNQKSTKLNHESTCSSIWKLGLFFWSGPGCVISGTFPYFGNLFPIQQFKSYRLKPGRTRRN